MKKMWIKSLTAAVTIIAIVAGFQFARSSYGPPLAPEDVHPNFADLNAPDDCLMCHGEGSSIETPHPERHSCKQCHLVGMEDGEDGGGEEAALPANRAFPGAPPFAPADAHPDFYELKPPDDCLACHGAGGVIESSHPERHSCQQCHIPMAEAGEESDNAGNEAVLPANRVFPGAPPLAPGYAHPDYYELKPPDDCLTCHGEGGVIESSHPERHSCQQCHIPFFEED